MMISLCFLIARVLEDMSYLFIYLFVIITGSITCSANRRYLIYSEADFEVFRPAGATRCTDGGGVKFGTDEGTFGAKFHPPHRCNDKGVGPQN